MTQSERKAIGMKTSSIPAILLVLLYLAFAASVGVAYVQLPERVASHFNAAGQPDGWMSRTTHLVFMSAFGLLFPLLMLGIFSAVKYLPPGMVNIPHREYWLAPERKAETCRYLTHHALWFACLLQAFFTGIHVLVIEANRTAPAELSSPGFLSLVGLFLVAVAVWIVAMIRHFRVESANAA